MGVLVVDLLRVLQLYVLHDCQHPAFPLLLAELRVDAQHLAHLLTHLHQWVHGAHGLLENHADLPAVDLAQSAAGGVEQVVPVQQDIAGQVALLAGQQTGDAHGGNGFAAAALAHQPQDPSIVDGKGYAGHRFAVPVMEFYVEITDFQHHATSLSIFCRPSPIRPTPNTSRAMTAPVHRAYHGARDSLSWASDRR